MQVLDGEPDVFDLFDFKLGQINCTFTFMSGIIRNEKFILPNDHARITAATAAGQPQEQFGAFRSIQPVQAAMGFLLHLP